MSSTMPMSRFSSPRKIVFLVTPMYFGFQLYLESFSTYPFKALTGGTLMDLGYTWGLIMLKSYMTDRTSASLHVIFSPLTIFVADSFISSRRSTMFSVSLMLE